MNTNAQILTQVKKWIIYAEEDLCLAKHSLKLESGCPFRLTAYHAQQCAEKYLKAFLVYNQIDFPYTHSIIRLLEICSSVNQFPELKEAEELTPFAITTRYPDEDDDVNKEEAVIAIELAEPVKIQLQKNYQKFFNRRSQIG
jgi:HEPN domain-containing protein